MTKIKCIAIDDEPLALELIADNMTKVEYLDCVNTFTSPLKAKEFLEKNRIDLVFLDIQMPEISGIDLARSLQNVVVIFTTAFDNYALDGFEVSALDYILKPITLKRFEMACARAKEYIELKANSISSGAFIFVRSDHQTLKLAAKDILYIEGLKDYVKIFTSEHEKAVITRLNLKGLNDLLPSKGFKRIHKSYIVNMSKVNGIGTDFVKINTDLKLPLGETYKKDLKMD